MNPQRDRGSDGSRSGVLRVLADERRREILDVLLNRTSPVAVADLTSRLAAAEVGGSALDVPDEVRSRVRTDLVHAQLPSLEDAGLVAWDEQAGVVETTDHPAFEEPAFGRLLQIEVDGIDDVMVALSAARRREVLRVVVDEQSPTSRVDLARTVARSETGESDPDSAVIDAVAVSLHHVHLPTLDDAGVLEYDPETDRVTYTEHPALAALLEAVGDRTSLVDRFDALLGGLGSTYRRASREADDSFDLPPSWTDPHHG